MARYENCLSLIAMKTYKTYLKSVFTVTFVSSFFTKNFFKIVFVVIIILRVRLQILAGIVVRYYSILNKIS